MPDPGYDTDLAYLHRMDPAASLRVDDEMVETALERLRQRRAPDGPRAVAGRGGDPHEDLAVAIGPRRGTRRRTLRRGLLVAAVLAGAAGATTLVALDLEGPDRAHVAAGPDERAMVEREAPLLTTAQTSCGVDGVPVTALAGPADAETQQGPAGDALRAFLANNPWGWVGPVAENGWALLLQTDEHLAFGVREGPLGVGRVVTFNRSGDRYQPASLGAGCDGITLASGEPASAVMAVNAAENSLQVTWVTSFSPSCSPARASLVRVDVAESANAVHILVVVAWPPPGENSGKTVACAAPPEAPTTAVTSVQLDGPLGARTLYDDDHIPPTPIPVTQRPS